jgi:hypothetical protein
MYYAAETLKRLVKSHVTLSGVIVKIDGVGYALWSGLNFDKIAEISKNYLKANLPYPFAPKYSVANQPAEFVMNTIHFLNEEDDLAGLAKHQEFRLLAA